MIVNPVKQWLVMLKCNKRSYQCSQLVPVLCLYFFVFQEFLCQFLLVAKQQVILGSYYLCPKIRCKFIYKFGSWIYICSYNCNFSVIFYFRYDIGNIAVSY